MLHLKFQDRTLRNSWCWIQDGVAGCIFLGGLKACCFYLFLEVAGRQFVLRICLFFFQSTRGHRKWCWCSNIQWSWFAYSPCLNIICFVSVLKKWVWVVPLCVQSCKNQHVHLLKVSVPQKNQRNLHFPPIMASSVGGMGFLVIVHHPEMAMKNPGSRGGWQLGTGSFGGFPLMRYGFPSEVGSLSLTVRHAWKMKSPLGIAWKFIYFQGRRSC